MELGGRSRSFGEFRERFRAYKLEQGCLYGPRGCVSVRRHHQRGTAGRRDGRFMQVKFGCAWIRKCSKKRKRKQPSLCPAYFKLQYKEDTDQLVVSKVNTHHAHPRGPTPDGPVAKLQCKQRVGDTESSATAGKTLDVAMG